MKTASNRVTTTQDYDSDTGWGAADLTAKQYEALETVARLSPGYSFQVVRYQGTGSRATHVKVWADGNEHDYVGLVGHDTVQYYDNSETTKQVVKRVAHRIYRFSGFSIA